MNLTEERANALAYERHLKGECCQWPKTTTVPNEQELVLRIRYDKLRVPVSFLTDALGETMREFGAPFGLVCADELSGPDTGDYDWSFDKHAED